MNLQKYISHLINQHGTHLELASIHFQKLTKHPHIIIKKSAGYPVFDPVLSVPSFTLNLLSEFVLMNNPPPQVILIFNDFPDICS